MTYFSSEALATNMAPPSQILKIFKNTQQYYENIVLKMSVEVLIGTALWALIANCGDVPVGFVSLILQQDIPVELFLQFVTLPPSATCVVSIEKEIHDLNGTLFIH